MFLPAAQRDDDPRTGLVSVLRQLHDDLDAAVAQALQAAKKPVTPADVGQVFMRANTDDVVRLLEMLAAIGKARTIKGGKYVAS